MAEGDLEGFDVKDEELVDFEGSDYGFCSDEELYLEEEQHDSTAEEMFSNPQELVKYNDAFVAKQVSKKEGNSAGIPDAVQASLILPLPQNREQSEAGEIENSWQEKQDHTVSNQLMKSPASSVKADSKEIPGDAHYKKHYKADLEDGELVDLATLPEGSDYDAVRSYDNCKDDAGGIHEKKRRRYRFSSERHCNGPEQDKKEHFGSGYSTGRQFRGRGRPMERPGGFPQFVEGGRGMNVPVPGFGGPNFGRVIGPGRPLVPIDLFAQVPLPHVGHGLMVPPGGITPPGRPDFPVSDVIIHDQLLQCQRMAQQIAQLGGPGIGRNQLNRPTGAAPLHPFVGLEFMGPGQGMMQLQPQGPDISSNSSGRGHRSSFAEGRGSMPGTSVSVPGLRNGRLGWVPPQSAGNSHFRGRGRGRGHLTMQAGPNLGDNIVVGGPLGMDAFQPDFRHASARGGQMLNIGHSYGPTVPNSNAHIRPSPQFHGGMRPSQPSIPDNFHGVGERFQRNGFVQNARPEANNAPAIRADFKGMNIGNHKNERHQEAASALVSGTICGGNGTSTSSTSSVIHLSGPIQKSRVLTVCGLPANSTMSTIVEIFEKQGKIMDFRKNEQGDVFTITFSNVTDAVSAKRRLHRSMLAGCQITVEYATG